MVLLKPFVSDCSNHAYIICSHYSLIIFFWLYRNDIKLTKPLQVHPFNRERGLMPHGDVCHFNNVNLRKLSDVAYSNMHVWIILVTSIYMYHHTLFSFNYYFLDNSICFNTGCEIEILKKKDSLNLVSKNNYVLEMYAINKSAFKVSIV